jgi:hypothetical protein
MAGRGPQSFKKRQKEQQRKEKQLEKNQKRAERKDGPKSTEEELVVLSGPLRLPEFMDEEEDETAEEESETSVVSKVH